MSTASIEAYDLDVAAEVRAMAARRMLTSKQIAAYLEHDEMWTSRRMRGKIPWTPGELKALSTLFNCPIGSLLPHLDSNQKPFDYRLRLVS